MTEKPTERPIDDDFSFEASDVSTKNDAKDTEVDDEHEELDAVNETQKPDAKPSVEQKLKIKFNGAEEEFDLVSQREEVIALIQKGKNYDHVVGERDLLKNSEELKFIDDMAKEMKVDRSEFIKQVRKDLENQKIQARKQELMDEGMTEDHAIYTAKLELKANATPPQVAETVNTDGAKAFLDLLTKYPETSKFKTLEEFPESVAKSIKEGELPIVAYQQYLIDQKEADRVKLELAQKNKERDLGSMKSGKDEEKEDPFISALFK